MMEINRDGLLLCKMQGRIFEKSLENNQSSSEIFIRRFMNSNIAKEFDNTSILDNLLSENDVLNMLNKEYGESIYGKNKYDKEVMYWIGYIYRYMSFTKELTARQVYKIIKPKELSELYYVYHSLDCQKAIELIFEQKKQIEDNSRLLKIIKRKKYEGNVVLINHDKLGNEESFSCYKGIEDIKIDNKKIEIQYNGEIIAEVDVNNIKQNCVEFVIQITKEKYNNDEMEWVLINKVEDKISANNNDEIINTKIKVLSEEKIKLYKSLGYNYYVDNENEILLRKIKKK